jgi:hypothetical protein
MQYILSEEEFKTYVPETEHKRIVRDLLKNIEDLEKENKSLIEHITDEGVPCKEFPIQWYCDGCPLGFEKLGVCQKTKYYSK